MVHKHPILLKLPRWVPCVVKVPSHCPSIFVGNVIVIFFFLTKSLRSFWSSSFRMSYRLGQCFLNLNVQTDHPGILSWVHIQWAYSRASGSAFLTSSQVMLMVLLVHWTTVSSKGLGNLPKVLWASWKEYCFCNYCWLRRMDFSSWCFKEAVNMFSIKPVDIYLLSCL